LESLELKLYCIIEALAWPKCIMQLFAKADYAECLALWLYFIES